MGIFSTLAIISSVQNTNMNLLSWFNVDFWPSPPFPSAHEETQLRISQMESTFRSQRGNAGYRIGSSEGAGGCVLNPCSGPTGSQAAAHTAALRSSAKLLKQRGLKSEARVWRTGSYQSCSVRLLSGWIEKTGVTLRSAGAKPNGRPPWPCQIQG